MSQDRKIVMVGLDAAGKTTVLYQLKLQEVLMTIPTIGAEMGFLLKMTHVYIVVFLNTGKPAILKKAWV